MATVTTQVCLLLSALFSLVYSQVAQPIDPSLGSPFGQPFIPGGGFDPNLNAGTFPTDPNLFAGMGNPGMTGQFPGQPAPLPRPNPMQALMPLMLFRGGDMAQMMALMSMLGGGLGGGGGGMSPFMTMMLMNGMM